LFVYFHAGAYVHACSCVHLIKNIKLNQFVGVLLGELEFENNGNERKLQGVYTQ